MVQFGFLEWIRRKIAPPLAGVGFLLLASQLAIVGIIFKTTYQKQHEFLRRFESISLEAIGTHQPKLLNHFGAIATSEINAELLVLCDSERKVLWSYPSSALQCNAQDASKGTYILKESLFSDQEYPLVIIHAPRWPSTPILWVLLAATLSIALGGAYLLWRIRIKIQKDIYLPVTQISNPGFQTPILELCRVKEDLNLLRKKEQEQAALIAIGVVASQVAHDIRSPLSSMRAALMLLRDKFGNDRDAEDMLNLLQLSSNRLDNIANGLLAKYMGESATEQLFSIHEVLDELVGELKASPLGRGVEFTKHYHSGALYVLGDKTGMARAIGNVVKNALEAMGQNNADKPRQLIVSTALALPPHSFDFAQDRPGPLLRQRRTDAKGEEVSIRITDTGPGIPAVKIPLILQGGYTEDKADGHGIGTKVVKEMVETHQGHLAIESQVGVGTTFIIMLPATIQNDETIVTIPYAGSGAIYVIDDEPSLREQWRLTLRGMGVTAKVFTCWEDFEANRHPRIGTPSDSGDPVVTVNPGPPLPLNAQCGGDDVFIIDYHFDNSEVDGIEVIRRLKELGYTNFVLATAEYWKPAIKDAANKLGIVLCPKPLPKVVLSQPVQQPQPTRCHPEPEAKDRDSSGAKLPQNDRGESQNDKIGPSVLIIDDDSSIHLSWRLMRTTLGVGQLIMHSNLEELIAAATNPAQFDLCVIDKNIEGSQFDGARTLDYLRQNGARIVVLASGETEDDIRKDPRFNAADGILKSKVPMSPDELSRFLN